LGRFGGPSWAFLWAPWGSLGPSGTLLGCLGALLGRLGPLERHGGLLGQTWHPLGIPLCRPGALLGRIWPLMGNPGASLGPSLSSFGPSWCDLWGLLCRLGRSEKLKNPQRKTFKRVKGKPMIAATLMGALLDRYWSVSGASWSHVYGGGGPSPGSPGPAPPCVFLYVYMYERLMCEFTCV